MGPLAWGQAGVRLQPQGTGTTRILPRGRQSSCIDPNTSAQPRWPESLVTRGCPCLGIPADANSWQSKATTLPADPGNLGRVRSVTLQGARRGSAWGEVAAAPQGSSYSDPQLGRDRGHTTALVYTSDPAPGRVNWR